MVNKNIIYDKRQLLNDSKPYIKGEYVGRYYKTDDKVSFGKDGQHIRFTFHDKFSCSIVEIFSLAKSVDERYDDNVQKSYGKIIQSSKNIEEIFKVKYDAEVKNNINVNDSLALLLNNKTIIYNEDSEILLNNSVLGNKLVKVLDEIIDSIEIINKDLSLHVHPNTAKPVVWRTEQLKTKLNKIREYLPNILSTNLFIN